MSLEFIKPQLATAVDGIQKPQNLFGAKSVDRAESDTNQTSRTCSAH